ncbi:hypothetical protein [Methylomonas sp. UP202]|uniref:hypothetical protein n=1 Tax=Methylomonas sp. UP202 TaxID=3040943 RepID=UPI00247B1DB4|nr:hypothetical protein [Methylomonas sp. UP202]WGS86804.1 hypothetical protein QC632_03355 [Methylomonas sp. UP202]
MIDQSGNKKKEISRTYQGMGGYLRPTTPVGAYLGNEVGCALGLELRPGRWHSYLEFEYFLKCLFPRVNLLSPKEQRILLRKDSGFEYLVKRYPRRQNKYHWVAEAASGLRRKTFGHVRSAIFDGFRTCFRQTNPPSLAGNLPSRAYYRPALTAPTVDGHQTGRLLDPSGRRGSQGGRTLRDHGTHGQFHSEIKTDLDLERLLPGKACTKRSRCIRAILRLGSLTYNGLRLLGQLGLLGDRAPDQTSSLAATNPNDAAGNHIQSHQVIRVNTGNGGWLWERA